MANQLQFGNKVVFLNGLPFTLPIAATDPVTAVAGDLYYNSVSNTVRYYNGSAWAPIAGFITGLPLAAHNVIIGDNSTNQSDAVDTSSVGDILADSTLGLSIKSGIIVNAMVSPSAAIAYTKLNLNNSIVDSDINTAAAIAYSKLNLSASIVNSDVSPTASIAYSKLNLSGSIVNTDISNTANILYTKLNLGNSIVDSDINTAAAIAYSKLAPLGGSTNDVLIQDGSGFVAPSSILSTNLFLADGSVSATGNFNLNSNKITNLTAGSSASDAVNYGQVILANGANAFTANQSLGGFIITNSGAPVNPNDLVTKAYVDSVGSGLSWLAPVNDMCLADDSLSTPPVSPRDSVVYIIGTSPTGAWTSFGAGHAVWWRAESSQWIDLFPTRTIQAGDRFVINHDALFPTSLVGGSFAGHTNSIVQVTGGVPGAWTYSFTVPANTNAVSVINSNSDHFGQSYTFTSASSSWLQFSGPASTALGNALTYVSSVLNVLFDNTTIDINGSNQLEVKAGGITNTQVSASAAIARSKLASGTNYAWVTNSSAGVMQDTSVTANRAVATDANGLPVASTTTATELGYVSGVTSAIQTQLNGKANTALSNLASVAINASLIAGSDAVLNLGSAALRWATVYATSLLSVNTPLQINSGSANIQIYSASFQRSADGTNYLTQTYTDSISLSDNQSTPTTAFQFAYASVAGYEISYVIESGNATKDCRVGTLRVTSNNAGTIVAAETDQYGETADCGVQWSATVSGANVLIQYTTTNQGAARTMRADIKSFRR
jgi:hypothetical protein